MPWASPAPMLEQFVGTFTKPGASRVEKMKLAEQKINIVNDYRLRWRDTVRKGKYQNGAGWLTSLGEGDMQLFIDEGKRVVDASPKANLDGSHQMARLFVPSPTVRDSCPGIMRLVLASHVAEDKPRAVYVHRLKGCIRTSQGLKIEANQLHGRAISKYV